MHYHFAEKAAMEAPDRERRVSRYARVHENVYGDLAGRSGGGGGPGKICILDIDVQGAEICKKAASLNARFLFVSPPSVEELERRLRGRGTEKEASAAVRMANAAKEMAKTEEPGFFDLVIVNDDLEKAYAEMKKFILP